MRFSVLCTQCTIGSSPACIITRTSHLAVLFQAEQMPSDNMQTFPAIVLAYRSILVLAPDAVRPQNPLQTDTVICSSFGSTDVCPAGGWQYFSCGHWSVYSQQSLPPVPVLQGGQKRCAHPNR